MRTDVAPIEVLRPKRLKEALAMMAEAAAADAPLTPLAGGTDVFVALNAGTARERRFIDLRRIDSLRYIRMGGPREKTIEIGALATYTDCRESKHVHRRARILADAAREVGGVQIQNRGTVAGNVGNGSPAGDALPVLLAMDALVVLRCSKGQREVPLADYYTGYRASVRRPDELIVELRVRGSKAPSWFRKVGTRAAQAISKVVVAASGDRVAFGSVAATVVRARRLETYLSQGGRDPEEARQLVIEELRPIDDVRSTAAYRSRVAGNLAAEYVARRG